MDTRLASRSREVVVSIDRPFVIIGERINPTGRKVLAAEMKEGRMDRVRADAIAQVAAGAHMLDINAGIPMADEPALLVAAIRAVAEVTDAPICIDSSIIEALEAGLSAYQGKALVNSVTAEEERRRFHRGARGGRTRRAIKHGHLAKEISRADGGEGAGFVVADHGRDLHLPVLDHIKPVAGIAGRENDLAGVEGPQLPRLVQGFNFVLKCARQALVARFRHEEPAP